MSRTTRGNGIGSHTHNRRRHSEMPRASGSAANASSSSRFWDTVMNTELGPGPPAGVQCSDCHQVFRNAVEMMAHRAQRHRAVARPFKCMLGCQQDFTQRSHLNQHIRTVHQQQKPYQCDLCHRAFGKRFDLSSHISAVHHNERPHKCKHCDKAFAKRSNLVRHQEKLHPELSPNKRPRQG